MTSTDLHAERAHQLMTLFPGHPEHHLFWIAGTTRLTRKVIERHSRASLSDYTHHLAPASQSGPGALGIMPGLCTAGVWRTPWAALDFDDQKPDELAPLFQILRERHNLVVNFNVGTTGRAAHVWFLLNQAITLRQAHKSLDLLARAAKAMGITGIDLRPQTERSTGSGLFLPYRGAGEDGQGFNPLISSETGEVIPLEDLNMHTRQSAQAFAALGNLRSVDRFLRGPTRVRRKLQLPRLESVIGDGDESRWVAELDRLGEVWEQGRRHYLTVAATAYGVHLGIPSEQIMEDLLCVARDHDDEELDDRRQAIRDGLNRAGRNEPLSYAEFYGRAEVDLPERKASPESRLQIGDLLNTLMRRRWPGRAGKTDRSLLRALLALAWRHGHEHPEGTEISVSWTELERRAEISSSDTLNQSLARLEAGDWLRRGARAAQVKSGSFILLGNNRSVLLRGEGIREEHFVYAPHLRYGRGRLGKSAEEVFDLLLWFGPQTRSELAERLEIHRTDLRKKLLPLLKERLVEEDRELPGKTLRVAGNLAELLEERFRYDGTQVARKQQETRHKDSRDRYRKVLVKQRKAG